MPVASELLVTVAVLPSLLQPLATVSEKLETEGEAALTVNPAVLPDEGVMVHPPTCTPVMVMVLAPALVKAEVIKEAAPPFTCIELVAPVIVLAPVMLYVIL